MPPDYTEAERAAFLREHRDLAYASRQMIEREMAIEDAARSLELAERYLGWLDVILDPEAPPELKVIAAEMVYLTGSVDIISGKGLP